MIEIWKDIKGFEGIYMVSNLGRVKSFKNNRWGIKDKPYFLKIMKDKTGYGYVFLRKDGKYKIGRLSRLVAELFLPNPYKKKEVNHKDFNPENNTVENLEWCTKLENMRHSARNLRFRKKLNITDVLKIKEIYNFGSIGMKKIGKQFNVSKTTIRNIVYNRHWRHLLTQVP